MFLPHLDDFCDQFLNRRTATWNLFVLYNKGINCYDVIYASVLQLIISKNQSKYENIIQHIILTNSFHVAVRLFSNRSQMTSKCGKNKKPASAHFGEHEKAIWRNLLSIQIEAISLVAMRSKEFWLVQENHATVTLDSSVASRGMKTYSESRIELRNLQILKKIMDKSSQVLSSEQPCESKSLDVASNIAGVEKLRSENLRLWSIWRPFDSSFEWKER